MAVSSRQPSSVVQIIFIVFNIYSVDESDLQRDEVAIIKVFVKNIYIPTGISHLALLPH